MRLVGKKKLVKLKNKNKGNVQLVAAIDKLIKEIEDGKWKNGEDLKKYRPDADCVHNDGFFFFDINVHRTLILIEFNEEGEATVIWAGTHQEYDSTFKGNKNTIKK